MIKHNSPSNVISPYNLVVNLDRKVRKEVNENFIYPIIQKFFEDKGGVENFEVLDPDKITTELEFLDITSDKSFVKEYIYKEIMPHLSKNENKSVHYLPRYVITFDEDLSGFEPDKKRYPYKEIFNDKDIEEPNIWFGVIRLGNTPILYYIFIELQEMIRFLKTVKVTEEETTLASKKIETPPELIRNNLIHQLIAKKQSELFTSTTEDKASIRNDIERLLTLTKERLEGERGVLSIQLTWNTTDDLDLHIESNSSHIYYGNKIVENEGIIGKLDVDANAGLNNLTSTPKENITWDGIPEGLHTVKVDFYSSNDQQKVPFTLFIENGQNSQIYDSFVEHNGANKTRNIVQFQFIGTEIKFTPLI